MSNTFPLNWGKEADYNNLFQYNSTVSTKNYTYAALAFIDEIMFNISYHAFILS